MGAWVLWWLVVFGCGAPGEDGSPDSNPPDTDELDNEPGDTDVVDTDVGVEPIEEQTFVRYAWSLHSQSETRVEVWCDGEMRFAQDDFAQLGASYEVRLDVEPQTACFLRLTDALGHLPEAVAYGCDVEIERTLAQGGFGPVDVGSLIAQVCVPGCMDPLALNFDVGVTVDDGSCAYVWGCTHPLADNYLPEAVVDDGSCIFDGMGLVEMLILTDWSPYDTGVEVICSGVTIFSKDDYTIATTVHPHEILVDAGFDCVVEITDDIGDRGPAGEVRVCGDLVLEWDNIPGEQFVPYTKEAGSFFVHGCSGCTNPVSVNYDPDALVDDGSC